MQMLLRAKLLKKINMTKDPSPGPRFGHRSCNCEKLVDYPCSIDRNVNCIQIPLTRSGTILLEKA